MIQATLLEQAGKGTTVSTGDTNSPLNPNPIDDPWGPFFDQRGPEGRAADKRKAAVAQRKCDALSHAQREIIESELDPNECLNIALSGKVIESRYVGIWMFLALRDGFHNGYIHFTVDEVRRIAAATGNKPCFVQEAVQHFAAANCLQGLYPSSTKLWFSDVPFRAHKADVTDQDVINREGHIEHYWRKRPRRETHQWLSKQKSERFDLIYLIGTRGSRTAKIGISSNVRKRLKDIQACSGPRVSVLWTAPGTYELESHLHRHFGEYRDHGEWFVFPGRDFVYDVQSVLAEIVETGAVEVSA